MSPKSRHHAPASDPAKVDIQKGQRLQKVLASAGIASRRECEVLILAGRVEVDRNTVTVLGTRVDPSCQEIRVDGTPLARPRHSYYLVNKPVGVVCTNRDPEGRPRVIDLVPSETRLFAVGRLDRSSEGLILVTNDGELGNQLTHPRYEISKTYRAKVLGVPSSETLQTLRKGVYLADGVARVSSLRVKGRHARGSELEIVLTEGRNREIRRILARVGHKVLHLRRIAIGPLRAGKLAVGEWRRLTLDEVQQLRRVVERPSGPKRPSTAATATTPRRSTPSRGPNNSRGSNKTGQARTGNRQAKKPQKGPAQKTRTESAKKAGAPKRAKPHRGAVLDYDQVQDAPSRSKKTGSDKTHVVKARPAKAARARPAKAARARPAKAARARPAKARATKKPSGQGFQKKPTGKGKRSR